MTALGSTGLQLYNFGQTISLPFFTDMWKPTSWYDKLEENLRIGTHTLVLLDIKVREQSEENMARWVVATWRLGPNGRCADGIARTQRAAHLRAA
jgi:diphthamide biosynthesis methyltransferase